MGIFKSSPGGSNVQLKLRTLNLAIVLNVCTQAATCVHTPIYCDVVLGVHKMLCVYTRIPVCFSLNDWL